MLFQSRTAQCSVFQGEDEVSGTRTTHGYDFAIPVQPGEVTVRFTNTTADTVKASLEGGEENISVPSGGSHDFSLTVTETVSVRLSWGTRNAMLTFTV